MHYQWWSREVNKEFPGFMVILPDYYKGDFVVTKDDTLVDFLKKHTKWENLKADADKVIAFAKGKGAKVFGSVGEYVHRPLRQ